MTCMTTKKKFDVEDPEVVVLNNGRYAYKVMCPWKGKNDKDLYAFKFASVGACTSHRERQERERVEDKKEEEVSD